MRGSGSEEGDEVRRERTNLLEHGLRAKGLLGQRFLRVGSVQLVLKDSILLSIRKYRG